MSDYTPTTDEVLRCFRLPMSAEQGQRVGESFAEFLSRRSIESFQQQIADREAAARWLAEVERAAAEKAWKRLAEIVYPLYEAAEAVLLAGADTQKLMGPLAKLGAQSNPYRINEGEKQ